MRVCIVFAVLLELITATDLHAQFRRSRERASAVDNNLNYSNPSEFIIAGIEVEGLQILDKNAMISLTGLRVGDKIKIPGDAISGAIRRLWKHGLIGDVTISVERIDGNQVWLLLTLAERPRLTHFYFTGINKTQESSLKEELKLIRGKIVNEAMIRNTELSVKKFFIKKGYLNTQVKITQEQDTLSHGIRLRIAINTGSKVKIHKIQFEGNEVFADHKLKAKMKKTAEYPRIALHRTVIRKLIDFRPAHIKSWINSSYPVTWNEFREALSENIQLNFFKGSKFIAADFEEDKEKIIEFYNTRGYRDAEILYDTLYAYNNKSIIIRINIHEGHKYYFRNIYWTGNYIHSDNTLNSILGIQKGDVYNRDLIEKKITFNPKGSDITGLYMDDGYLFFRVTPVEYVVGTDSIDVEMRIFEGEQATINEVTISGNERTNDHVIRRELYTLPGQKFRRSDIIRTQQKLSQLGYFNPQKINPHLVPNPANGTVNIEWQLEEQSNDQIEMSGGWGGVLGFVGTVGLTFNNFSVRNITNFSQWRPLPVGDGQRLSLRVQANGRRFQNYSISFTEPWLGGRKPQSFTISANKSLSRQLYDQPDSLGFIREIESRIGVNNISLGLGRVLNWPDNFFTLTNSLSFTEYDLRNAPAYIPGCNSCRTNSITFNATLARNSIDNPMYPAQGSMVSLSGTFTPPFSMWRRINLETATVEEIYRWVEYYKIMFDAKYYMALDRKNKLVIEAKGHFGFIGRYTRSLDYTPFERFFLGGAGIAGGFGAFVLGQDIIALRGYDDNQITPPYNALDRSVRGGIVYNKFGVELRYPVTTGNAATIYGFLFAEAGNNWNNYRDFNPFNLYKAVGFGVRIFMPAFGLIGLNWGLPLDPFPLGSDRPIGGAKFQFTIGQQIR